MAIQIRRGDYLDFDPSRLLAGELAAVLENDPNTDDGTALYACFGANDVKRVMTDGDVKGSPIYYAGSVSVDSTGHCTATVDEGFELVAGVSVIIYPNNTSSSTHVLTLNVNGTGDISVYERGVQLRTQHIEYRARMLLTYDGSHWELINDLERYNDHVYSGVSNALANSALKGVSVVGAAGIYRCTLIVTFKYDNTAPLSDLQLCMTSPNNENVCTASIRKSGSALTENLVAGVPYVFRYDGWYWQLIGILPTKEPASASSSAPIVDGTASAGSSSAYARGDHVHPTDTSRMAASLKGVANGVAELDSSGKVPSSQLPSFVDDVLEYATLADFPVTGETGKIYVDLSTNKTYRWSGSAYVEISASLALGETDSTAYRGDRGKTAYDHASAKGSAFSSGLYKITTNAEGHVTAAAAVQKSDITALGIPGDDYTLPTMGASTKGGAKVGSGLRITDEVLSTTNDMGLSGTSVGQVPVVATVDANGVPTSWGSVLLIWRTLTVTVTTHDAQTVTGVTVTVRLGGPTGEVLGTATYNGSPLTFLLQHGTDYYVSVSDDLRMYGPPSTASGTILANDASVTLTYAALNSVLEKDTNTGRYTNASLSDWWSRQKDGKVYGVSIPKSTALLSTKTRDNANIADPVPSTLAVTGSDPYATGKCGPYLHYDVNGGTDTDGTPYVTAIRGIDNDFALDGTNGNVWSMCPVLFEKWTNDTSSIEWAVSDTEFDGSTLQPGAKLPASGTRPYMLYAKYGGGMYNGAYASVSGVDVRTRDVSHNTLITITSSASTGYSGKSVADDWYQKMLWYTKYSDKDKQNYMQGCTNYNLQYYVTVAETNTRRVIISKTNAANLLVGSTVCLGTRAGGNSDRNRADMHDVVDLAHITAIEDYDSSNSAITLDVSADFTTATTYMLSTMPWRTGFTDGITFDGSPSSNSSGKEPYVINGIEMAYGCYEIVSGVIVSNDGVTGWTPYTAYDTQNDTTSLTANYTSCGAVMPSGSSVGWQYPLYPEEHGTLIYGTTTGGSTTTGMADGQYMSKSTDTGTREWPSLGYLSHARYAGPSCVAAVGGLSNAGWNIGGRLSCNGRSRG